MRIEVVTCFGLFNWGRSTCCKDFVVLSQLSVGLLIFVVGSSSKPHFVIPLPLDSSGFCAYRFAVPLDACGFAHLTLHVLCMVPSVFVHMRVLVQELASLQKHDSSVGHFHFGFDRNRHSVVTVCRQRPYARLLLSTFHSFPTHLESVPPPSA